jgi:hypothetical protein
MARPKPLTRPPAMTRPKPLTKPLTEPPTVPVTLAWVPVSR